jgi:hypothetical protein
MKKASNDVLVVEELIEIIRKIGKLRARINVAKDCLSNKDKVITEAILEWSRFELKASASLISTLCAGLDKDKRSSYFFEKNLNQYPDVAFCSLFDLREAAQKLIDEFNTTQSVYGSLKPLWKTAGQGLEKSLFEINNAIKSHK